jgi:DNA-binding transcriptional LysR family regulator
MLETWTLRVLVAVAEHGSFSAAAETLRMTQPAVSRQMAGLERRVGVRLFQRVPRGVRPTAAGEAAVTHARDVLDRLRAMQSRLAAFTQLDAGSLRLSAFPSANIALIPEAIRRFQAAHPGIELSLARHDPTGPLAAVRTGRLDLALVTGWELYADPWAARLRGDDAPASLEGVRLTPLLDDELLVALPSGHRLARRDRVPLRELRDETWIDGAFPDCLGPVPALAGALGASPRTSFICDDWNGKQALVAGGSGVTLLPTLARGAVREDVVVRPVTPRLPPRRLYAATAPAGQCQPAAQAMLAVITAVVADQTR